MLSGGSINYTRSRPLLSRQLPNSKTQRSNAQTLQVYLRAAKLHSYFVCHLEGLLALDCKGKR